MTLWDVTARAVLRHLTGHGGQVMAVAFSPDGTRLASAGSDGTVRLWDPATGTELHRLTGHENWVMAVAFSPDGRLASAGDDGTVRLWDPATGTELHRLTGHEGRVMAVAFSPDGTRLASAGSDGTVRLWDPARASLEATLVGAPAGWALLTPDGRYKVHGQVSGAFSYVIGLCRFEPGELTGSSRPGHSGA